MTQNLNFNVNAHFNDKLGLKITEEVFKRAMNSMRNEAILKAPVDTGELRSKIMLNEISNTRIDLESNAQHSIYMEYGTFNITPRAYLRPALDLVTFVHLPRIIQETKAKYS